MCRYPLRIINRVLKTCSEAVTKFEWICDEREALGSLDVLQVLKSMPNLSFLKIETPDSFKIDENHENAEGLENIKKLNLKSLQVDFTFETNLKFFLLFLNENSLIDCKIFISERREVDREAIKELFCKFFLAQKSLKNLQLHADPEFFEDAVKTLDLNELIIHSEKPDRFMNIIKNQPQLKKLSIQRDPISFELLEEISKLSLLESLEVIIEDLGSDPVEFWKFFGNFKNLKEFRINPVIGPEEIFNIPFFNNMRFAKIDSLKKLKIPGYLPAEFFHEISANFPNLKELEVRITGPKLNLLAKYFPKLEKLSVVGGNISELTELDTGIVGKNLKDLKLEILSPKECDVECFQKFVETFKIFPNLEHLNVCQLSWSDLFKNHKILFEKILKLKKLKSLEISRIPIQNCLEIVDELKILASKLESAKIILSSLFYRNLTVEERGNLNIFKETLKKYYQIMEDQSMFYQVIVVL